MTSLSESYAAVVSDLDGVVYRGASALPHAVESLNALGVPVIYATNNASRRPADVGDHLRSLGVVVSDDQVLTSALAGARAMTDLLPAGAPVLAIGGEGVADALSREGFTILRPGQDGAEGVLQGYGPDVTAEDLAQAAYAIQGGALWVVTNDDATLPTDRGVAPGNGTLVQAVATATGSTPRVVGKPHAPLYLLGAELLEREPRRILAVGDRLETDMAGAVSAGMDSALVLTGIHGVREAAMAGDEARPTYVLADLRGLLHPYPQVRHEDGWWVCGSAAVRRAGDRWERRESGRDESGPVHGGSGWTLDACRAALGAVAGMPRDVPPETVHALARSLPGQQ